VVTSPPRGTILAWGVLTPVTTLCSHPFHIWSESTIALALPPHLFGMQVSGDIGPLTIYTDRHGRKVAYPKSPPKSPPTEMQLQVRGRFSQSQAAYMSLSAADKLDWETLVRRANLCMTGQNLYIHVATMLTFDFLDTLMHQTGITVTPPDPV